MAVSDAQVLVDDMMYPEGPRWHDGHLYIADFYACEVIRADLSGHHEQILQVPGQPSGMGWLPDGSLIVVSMKDARLLKYDHGETSTVADLSAFSPLANDMVVDPAGRAYVGGMPDVYPSPDDLSGDEADFTSFPLENLYLVDAAGGQPNGGARTVATDLDFPNAAVITPDGGTLIVAESMAQALTAFDILEDGSLANRRLWAHLGQLLDGICLDAEGCIWAAVPFPDEARGFWRIAEGGEVKERIATDRAAMAVALGGPDGRCLFMVETAVLGVGHAPELRTRGNGRVTMRRVAVEGAGCP